MALLVLIQLVVSFPVMRLVLLIVMCIKMECHSTTLNSDCLRYNIGEGGMKILEKPTKLSRDGSTKLTKNQEELERGQNSQTRIGPRDVVIHRKHVGIDYEN